MWPVLFLLRRAAWNSSERIIWIVNQTSPSCSAAAWYHFSAQNIWAYSPKYNTVLCDSWVHATVLTRLFLRTGYWDFCRSECFRMLKAVQSPRTVRQYQVDRIFIPFKFHTQGGFGEDISPIHKYPNLDILLPEYFRGNIKYKLRFNCSSGPSIFSIIDMRASSLARACACASHHHHMIVSIATAPHVHPHVKEWSKYVHKVEQFKHELKKKVCWPERLDRKWRSHTLAWSQDFRNKKYMYCGKSV